MTHVIGVLLVLLFPVLTLKSYSLGRDLHAVYFATASLIVLVMLIIVFTGARQLTAMDMGKFLMSIIITLGVFAGALFVGVSQLPAVILAMIALVVVSIRTFTTTPHPPKEVGEDEEQKLLEYKPSDNFIDK